MRCLFVHQNFPGQFRHLAPALAADPANEVLALTMQPVRAPRWRGVRLVRYHVTRQAALGTHPWLKDLETKTLRAEAVFLAARQMRAAGFMPDLIIAHPGWGESLFLKEVWPEARLALYSEFYYRNHGQDVGFDHEFHPQDPGNLCRVRMKNMNNLLHFEDAQAGIAPTHWQASTFPEPFRSKITVIHDGIDCQLVQPRHDAGIALHNGARLRRGDEVITFVNRTLEPYRGYHVFMRALPELLRRRPQARVLIVGADTGGYGAPAPAGTSWREIFLKEITPQLAPGDLERIFYLDKVPYAAFISLLQLSTVHVYLTYPFVLSWSLLEAMSAGCAIVASDTAPVREAIRDGDTGRLVPFFGPGQLAATVAELLADPDARAAMGARARAFALANYDLHSICLPRQLAWVDSLLA